MAGHMADRPRRNVSAQHRRAEGWNASAARLEALGKGDSPARGADPHGGLTRTGQIQANAAARRNSW